MLPLGAINPTTGKYVYPTIATKVDKYSCPDCNKQLILCKGPKRVPYFRHRVNATNPCHYYSHPTESQTHKDAKMLMKTLLENRMNVSFLRRCSCCGCDEEFDIPLVSDSSSIELEYRFDYNDGLKIADVAYIENGELLCIFEVCHKHKTENVNRPEPWFEVDALSLIHTVNADLPSLKIRCIRDESCEECLEKKAVISGKEPTLEDFVRAKLGQVIPIQPCVGVVDDDYGGRCGRCVHCNHLRFNFDAQCPTEKEYNRHILDLFKDEFGNKTVVIHSGKGGIVGYIISNSNYRRYNYWGESLVYMRFPCEKIIDFGGETTVSILVKLIAYFKGK